MLSFEYIKYFLEACDSGSIQAASKKLYLSSQGLGAGIQRLENSIGMTLLSRSKSGVTPTQFGKEFYAYASRLSEDMDALEAFCTEYREKRNTSIRIGIIGESKFSGSIAICGERFNKTHPDEPIDIDIVSVSGAAELFQAMDVGDIDAGWIYHRDEQPGCIYRRINEYSPFVLICNRLNPLAKKDAVSVRDLQFLRFIQAGKTDPITDLVNEVFQQNGFVEDVAMYTTENSLIGNIIDNDIANILVRECYVPKILQYCRSSVAVPILPEIRIASSVVYRKNARNPQKGLFFDYMVDYLKKHIYNE